MNALVTIPAIDFRPAYWQIEPMERTFVDGYVADIESIAEKTGQRLLAVLQAPFPFELDSRGQALIARPMVRAAIAQRVHELSQLYDISTYRTLKELTSIAYSNIKDYIRINAFGEPEFDISKCTPEQLSAVKSFEIEDKPRGGRKIKFQLHDKMAGLQAVMRYQGLLSDDNEHWRKAVKSDLPPEQAQLPVTADDDQAAELYSRQING